RSPRRHFAAGSAVKKTLCVRLLSDAGSERRQLDKVTPVQGQLSHLLGRDHLAEGWVLRFNSDGSRIDFNSFLDRRWHKLEIQLAVFVDLQPDVLVFGGLKPLH